MPKKNKTKSKGKTIGKGKPKAIRRILSDDEGMDVDTPPRVPGTSPLEQLPRHVRRSHLSSLTGLDTLPDSLCIPNQVPSCHVQDHL